MLQHHFKSVIFVSHPYHSKRIETFASMIAGYKEAGLNLIVVGVDTTKKSRINLNYVENTMSELVKLFYNAVKYSNPFIQYTQYNHKLQNGEWERALKQIEQ